MLFGLFNPSQHSALLFSDVIFCYQHQEKESIANKQYGICVTGLSPEKIKLFCLIATCR